MFKLTVKINSNGVYVARLYQRLLWLFWIPERIEYAKKDNAQQVNLLKVRCFRWMEFHEGKLILKNKSDLNLNLQNKL